MYFSVQFQSNGGKSTVEANVHFEHKNNPKFERDTKKETEINIHGKCLSEWESKDIPIFYTLFDKLNHYTYCMFNQPTKYSTISVLQTFLSEPNITVFEFFQ
jgi:hypothetical protein